MQPLTPDVWQRHFAELRPYVLQAFPELDAQQLEAQGNDWQGLIAILQRVTGRSADDIIAELRKLDVEPLGLGTGSPRQRRERAPASIAQLRLGAGFSEAERDRIVRKLEKLNRQLKRFPSDAVDLEISVKDRDDTNQKVTLEAWLPKFGHLVATAQHADLNAALRDVREDLWRQIDDAVNRRREGAR